MAEKQSKKRFNKALRSAVEYQTKNWTVVNPFRRGTVCPVTGNEMTKRDSEVDHYPTSFVEIQYDWLTMNGLEWQDVEIQFIPERRRWVMSNQRQRESWQDFHQQLVSLTLFVSHLAHCVVQVFSITTSCHLARAL